MALSTIRFLEERTRVVKAVGQELFGLNPLLFVMVEALNVQEERIALLKSHTV